MPDTEALSRHADRVLKNYRNFQKLANLSSKPFSLKGQKLVNEIDRVIDAMTGTGQAILINQYLRRPKERKSRKVFCETYQISVKEYDKERQQALNEFAQQYRGGALLKIERSSY
ncbi:hypothetical protein [Streptococcus sp. sy018]|uniref:hypothetical protein n=1 Tax=Streptococcus sp. sy018 TaxID=2600147 RepID=UPI0011B497D7|nr:hypothetical protein [Streptococcus sp. sy018]TWS94569.1 hypothetical protein FRX52_03630 [Streptococcus sp. sy018]